MNLHSGYPGFLSSQEKTFFQAAWGGGVLVSNKWKHILDGINMLVLPNNFITTLYPNLFSSSN